MNFEVSKEEWKRELRSKSPIYAAYDENSNYYEVRKKIEENDTDTDSGLPSIDGDSAKDKALCNIWLEHDMLLMRQDSGLSSESSDISPPYLKSNKERQVLDETIATHNKALSRIENSKQVTVNRVPASRPELQNARKTTLRDSKCVKESEKNTSYKFDARENLVGKNDWLSKSAEENERSRRKAISGAKPARVHDDDTGDNRKRAVGSRNYSSHYSNTEKSHENMKEDRNNNNIAVKRELSTSRSTWSLRREKLKQSDIQKSHNRILRDELFQLYKETAEKITDTVDQLLYKDLMCAHLTEEILNFSNNNFSVDQEMLDLEEKFLEDQMFNSMSLLQTLETINDHQQVELNITLNKMKRIDIEIKEKVLKLQHMERAFRNMKFKHAPKQLKRYCSVESLLSDVDKHENEQKKPCDTIWDEKEELNEEISLV